ncbi:hypothetical protein POM88_025425 [Heracleum sosnowskyi]|uniref:Uncharacterized protein n=1 Tax=Heracleum sosnowskyi TaxID=360622 RepID=A0AAD8I462_9APIA|nr:hypothetical protein POM88_025425 [Heracleum sosnowskyi]
MSKRNGSSSQKISMFFHPKKVEKVYDDEHVVPQVSQVLQVGPEPPVAIVKTMTLEPGIVGCAFRGNDESVGSENCGNFIELLKFLGHPVSMEIDKASDVDSKNVTNMVHNNQPDMENRNYQMSNIREYNTLGPHTAVCQYCNVIMWKEERNNKKVTKGMPKFSLCCSNGQVRIPLTEPVPTYLQNLYDDKDKGPKFRKCIRICWDLWVIA